MSGLVVVELERYLTFEVVFRAWMRGHLGITFLTETL